MSTIKVFVAGHRGLAGSALARTFNDRSGYELIVADRSHLDLTKQEEVFRFMDKTRPDWVFIAAALVGGIAANKSYPVDFLLTNLKIQNHLIEAAATAGVKKLMFLASNCMYPREAEQPIRESALLTAPLEPTNEPYAVAKIAGQKLCDAYHRQHGKEFITVVPATMYGRNDNYNFERAHVLPMLLRRFHEAKLAGDREVTVWGSGTPRREFLFSDDFAEACLYIMENLSATQLAGPMNIGSSQEYTIAELAAAIREIVGLEAEIVFDRSKPDGMPRKLLDPARLEAFGWRAKTPFLEGLKVAYKDFLENPDLRK